MKMLAIVISSIFLTACASGTKLLTPHVIDMPVPPEIIMRKPENLKTIKEQAAPNGQPRTESKQPSS